MTLLNFKNETNNTDSFIAFYESHYECLFRFAFHFVPNSNNCQDILGDVFADIWENWSSLKKISNLKSYVYVSVRNRCLKHLKKQWTFEEYIEELHVNIRINEITPEDHLLTTEIRKVIEDALNQLPERCKLIILMLKEENLTYKEVASILQISEKTVQAQQIIAKKRLTETINKYLANE